MKTVSLIIIATVITVGLISFFGYDYLTAPSELQKIYVYCFNDSMGLGVINIGLSYTNGTHYIDNNTCEWQKKK